MGRLVTVLFGACVYDYDYDYVCVCVYLCSISREYSSLHLFAHCSVDSHTPFICVSYVHMESKYMRRRQFVTMATTNSIQSFVHLSTECVQPTSTFDVTIIPLPMSLLSWHSIWFHSMEWRFFCCSVFQFVFYNFKLNRNVDLLLKFD